MYRILIKAPCTRHFNHKIVSMMALNGGRIVNTTTFRDKFLKSELDYWEIEFTIDFKSKEERSKFKNSMDSRKKDLVKIEEL